MYFIQDIGTKLKEPKTVEIFKISITGNEI